MEPTALPRPLIRRWEKKVIGDDGKEKIQPVELMRPCEIPQYRTVFFSLCMNVYNNWRLFGKAPPNGQGWANERGVTCKIIRILETENNIYEEWKRDLEREKDKGKR